MVMDGIKWIEFYQLKTTKKRWQKICLESEKVVSGGKLSNLGTGCMWMVICHVDLMTVDICELTFELYFLEVFFRFFFWFFVLWLSTWQSLDNWITGELNGRMTLSLSRSRFCLVQPSSPSIRNTTKCHRQKPL